MTAPFVSRTNPVSVVLVTPTLGRVESTVSTGAVAIADGIAGRAGSGAAARAAGASVGADSTFGIGAVASGGGDAMAGEGDADAISPARAAGRCGSPVGRST